MTHQQLKPITHRAKAGKRGLIGAAVLALGLTPFAASADHSDRARWSLNVEVAPAAASFHKVSRRDRYAYDRWDERRGHMSAYFTRPHKPLKYKRWWRVEQRLGAYTPHLGHLNRYEQRQVIGHAYDRYLRDHRRWSQRVDRRLASQARYHRYNRSLDRHAHHDARYCDEPGHRHDRHRRW